MVRTIRVASDGIGFHLDGEAEIKEADVIVSGQRTQRKVAAQMQRMLQDRIDYRVPRSSLPNDEPTKAADPAKPNIFWDGGDIVSRSEIVTISVVDGKYVPALRVTE